MKLGFARINKKLSKKQLRSESMNGSIYYFDDSGRVVARLCESNLLSLVVTNQEGKNQSINLVFNFKYKCDQGVVIADIAFVSDLDDNKLPIVSKNRYLSFKNDPILEEFGTASIGMVNVSDNVMTVSVPILGVEDKCENVICNGTFSETLFNLTTRTVR